MKDNYLAVDLGAESGRVIVGTIHEDVLTLTEVYRFANQPVIKETGMHWNVNSLYHNILKGIKIASKEYELKSIGIDSWGVDFVLLDDHDNLLEDPYHYRDERTDGMLDAAYAKVPREEIFAQTGIQFMQINTLFQLLSMSLTHKPGLGTARTFLTIPDYFNFLLSGKKVCEFTNATTTQCLNPITRQWTDSLLESFNIPRRIFPDLCEPGTTLGYLQDVVAEEVGIDPIPVIAPACHDTGSAVVAVPAEELDFAWISSGTWSILGAEVTQPNLSQQALDGNFTNEGGVFGTWRLSKNIMGLWIVQECKREWGISYDEITRIAADAKPFIAVIDVDDQRFLHPGDMPAKVREYCRETRQLVPETKGEVIRTVLESIALKYRYTLTQLESLVGHKLEPIHIFGGGTQNELLNQFSADATEREIITGPVEATAAGNIVMQAITMGHLESLSSARTLIRRSFPLTRYQPHHDPRWEKSYEKLVKELD